MRIAGTPDDPAGSMARYTTWTMYNGLTTSPPLCRMHVAHRIAAPNAGDTRIRRQDETGWISAEGFRRMEGKGQHICCYTVGSDSNLIGTGLGPIPHTVDGCLVSYLVVQVYLLRIKPRRQCLQGKGRETNRFGHPFRVVACAGYFLGAGEDVHLVVTRML